MRDISEEREAVIRGNNNKNSNQEINEEGGKGRKEGEGEVS